jgi:hypothetical protein
VNEETRSASSTTTYDKNNEALISPRIDLREARERRDREVKSQRKQADALARRRSAIPDMGTRDTVSPFSGL